MTKKSAGKIPSPEELGQAVRRAYEAAGLSQTELATKLNTRQAQVSRWAVGANPPSIADMLRIEDACGCPRGYLLRLCGAIGEDATTVVDAITLDTAVPESLKAPLIAAYYALAGVPAPGR